MHNGSSKGYFPSYSGSSEASQQARHRAVREKKWEDAKSALEAKNIVLTREEIEGFGLDAWHSLCTQTLICLVTEEKQTPQEALKEMADLNIFHLEALREFYKKGLRGDHLRNWRGCDDSGRYHQNFFGEYKAALRALVDQQGMSISDAMLKITNITDDQAEDLCHRSRCKPQNG